MSRDRPERMTSPNSTRTVMGTIRRAAEILREEGIAALWFKALGETVYRRILLFERLLNFPVTDIPVSPDIEFGLVRSDEFERCAELRPGRCPSQLEDRLARGEHCYVARKSGIVIGIAWVMRRSAWIEYLRCTIDLGPNDYYLYELIVDPHERGERVAPALFAHIYRDLREAGAARAVYAVNLENTAVLRALSHNGERRYALHGYVGVGRLRHHFARACSLRSSQTSSLDPQHDSHYWDAVETAVADREAHYVDDLLATLKRRAYRRMLDRWAASRPHGPVLKTDLFEEANIVDALMPELPGGYDDAIGMDISPVVVGKARTGCTAPDAVYIAADVRRLPFATHSIAMVFSPSTLDHFADPADLGRSLAEFRRVLKPDGVLVLTLDNRHNVFDPLLRMLGRCGRLPYYLGRSYTVGEMRAELTATGFDVTDTTTLVQHPRLMGVAATGITNALGWQWVRIAVRRVFFAAERLENTRLRYVLGCFAAARAVPKKQ